MLPEDFESIEAMQENIKRMRRNAENSPNSKVYWSKDDMEKLRKMFCDGIGISQMALMMGRTERAIYQKIMESQLFDPVYRTKGKKEAECLCRKCGKNNHCEHGCKGGADHV